MPRSDARHERSSVKLRVPHSAFPPCGNGAVTVGMGSWYYCSTKPRLLPEVDWYELAPRDSYHFALQSSLLTSLKGPTAGSSCWVAVSYIACRRWTPRARPPRLLPQHTDLRAGFRHAGACFAAPPSPPPLLTRRDPETRALMQSGHTRSQGNRGCVRVFRVACVSRGGATPVREQGGVLQGADAGGGRPTRRDPEAIPRLPG